MFATNSFLNAVNDMRTFVSLLRAQIGLFPFDDYEPLLKETDSLSTVPTSAELADGTGPYYVIFGATRATPFLALHAYEHARSEAAGDPEALSRIRFIVLGGKMLGDERPEFRDFLEEQYIEWHINNPESEKIYFPHYAMDHENDIAKHVLGKLKDNSARIMSSDKDCSMNFTENLHVLRHIFEERGIDLSKVQLQCVSLAGTSYRLLGQAQKEFGVGDQAPVIAVKSAYPGLFGHHNYRGHKISALQLTVEGSKALPVGRDPAAAMYVQKGVMNVPDYAAANACIQNHNALRRVPSTDYVPAP